MTFWQKLWLVQVSVLLALWVVAFVCVDRASRPVLGGALTVLAVIALTTSPFARRRGGR